ncbi:MAG: 50S ribosomal protein L21 [Planctomycetes bacterium]|nr:50S ribosomal protein L21 [Planctomycetota bacterium]
MYAVIEDSGTQIKVAPGDVIDIDLRDLGAKKKKIKFDRVLVVGDDQGDSAASVGTPYVDGASVTAEVLEEIKGQKIDVIKFKRRKGYRRKTGHRQRYLRIKIEKIDGPKSSS